MRDMPTVPCTFETLLVPGYKIHHRTILHREIQLESRSKATTYEGYYKNDNDDGCKDIHEDDDEDVCEDDYENDYEVDDARGV